MKPENHPEITKVKNFDEIYSSPESFASLKDTLLLFDKDSKYYKYSGRVTAALLNFENENNKPLTLLATLGKEWIRQDGDYEYFKEVFKHCDAVIGKTEEESYFVQA